jgi:hypothetical protein
MRTAVIGGYGNFGALRSTLRAVSGVALVNHLG